MKKQPDPTQPVYTSRTLEKSPKTRLTEIIVDAVVLGLLVLSFIFSWFMPTLKVSVEGFEGYSASFSPMQMFVGTISMTGGNGAYVKDFKESGGFVELADEESKGGHGPLYYSERSGRMVFEFPDEELVLHDVEFKKAHTPSAFKHYNFIDGYFGVTVWKMDEAREELRRELQASSSIPANQYDTYLDLMKKERLDPSYPTIMKLAALDEKDIGDFNWSGFTYFIYHSYANFSENDGFDEATIKTYQDKYLLGEVNFEALKKVFEEDQSEGYFLEYMPTHVDAFDTRTHPVNGVETKVVFRMHYSTKPEAVRAAGEHLSVLAVYFGIGMVIVGLAELLYAIPVVLRLVNAIQGKPRNVSKKQLKLGKIKYNHQVIVCAIVMTFFTIISWGGAASQVTAPYIGAIAGASALTFIVSLGLAAAEIFYNIFAKKNPDREVVEAGAETAEVPAEVPSETPAEAPVETSEETAENKTGNN